MSVEGNRLLGKYADKAGLLYTMPPNEADPIVALDTIAAQFGNPQLVPALTSGGERDFLGYDVHEGKVIDFVRNPELLDVVSTMYVGFSNGEIARLRINKDTRKVQASIVNSLALAHDHTVRARELGEFDLDQVQAVRHGKLRLASAERRDPVQVTTDPKATVTDIVLRTGVRFSNASGQFYGQRLRQAGMPVNDIVRAYIGLPTRG